MGRLIVLVAIKESPKTYASQYVGISELSHLKADASDCIGYNRQEVVTIRMNSFVFWTNHSIPNICEITSDFQDKHDLIITTGPCNASLHDPHKTHIAC